MLSAKAAGLEDSNVNSNGPRRTATPSPKGLRSPSTEHGTKAQAHLESAAPSGKGAKGTDDLAKTAKAREGQRMKEREEEFKVKHVSVVGVLGWIL